MSTTVIPPNGSFYSHSGMDNSNSIYPILAAQHITDNNVSNSGYNVLNAVHTDSRLNGDAIGASSRDILQDSCASTANIIASNARSAFAIQDNADKNSNSVSQAVERTGLSNLTSTFENGSRNLQSIERNAGELRLINTLQSGEIRDNILTTHNLSQMAHKDTILDICKSNGSIELQAADNKGKVSLELCEVKNDIQLQAAQNYDGIQLEAFKNKELLAKQLADCCCEIKERIADSSSVTQQLIREVENNRVRDELNQINTRNMFLKFKSSQCAPPPAP